ncbi:MAG: hypothetical protein NTZ67_05100 [Gammaproteobacteria bacterium]|nr:hypothetical protein [Gammaproteobacteria bacterium]
MKKVVVTLVGAVALVTVGMAAAATTTSNMAASNQTVYPSGNNSGIFISGNAGYGEFDVSRDVGATRFNNSGFAWNGNVGYQFSRYFAVETGYTHFANVSESNNIGDSANVSDIYGVDLLAKGILPINSQFNVFAKAGAMYLSATPSFGVGNYTFTDNVAVTHYVPELGLGTAYYVSSNVSVSLQAITTFKTDNMPATYAAYAGLGYKFNM